MIIRAWPTPKLDPVRLTLKSVAIDQPTRIKVLYCLSVPLIVLALLFFLLGLTTMVGSDGDAAVGGALFFSLYILFAVPATGLIAVGIWLRGWKEARWGKQALKILLGIPLVVFGLLLVLVAASLAWEKMVPPKPPETMRASKL